MKRVRLFLLYTLIFTFGYQLHAQSNWCGTNQNEAFMQRLDANVKRLATLSPELRNVPKYIPITFILVADDNGNGRVQEERVLEQLTNLNNFYNSLEMVFYLDELRYLDKSVVYNTPSNIVAEIQMGIVKDNNAISVYVCNSADSGSGQPGLTLGYYDPSRDWLVMRKGQINLTSATLAHEIGHYFSLAHPHKGWECVAYNENDYGNPVTRTSTLSAEGCNQATSIIELVDGSNCTVAGDRVCDTPADYNFQFSPDYGVSNCSGNIGVLDLNGDIVEPMFTNLMGYYDNCGDYELTNGQNNLINSDYFSFDRAYIRTGNIPALDIVTGPVNYVYPENDGETSTFDNVTLDWEDVPGANQYLVIIDRFNTFSLNPERYIVSESELNLTNLEENKRYFWRVWPFNETSTDANWSETQSFTATTSTAIEKIDGLEEVQLYPNPVSSGGQLILNVTTREPLDVQIRLLDLHGREVQSFGNYVFQTGLPQKEVMNLNSNPNGLYVLQILSSEGGVFTKKIQVLN